MTVAVITQIAYAAQTLFDPAGTAGRLVDLGKLANYGLLTSFSPAFLFQYGEQGTWYDPSDLTTLFQDSAGTTPVTAVEQPVGLMKDKSGRGNHAFQTTSANRPVLSARVNLLTKTEQFDDAAWSKGGAGTVTPNTTVAPDNTLSADTLTGVTDSSFGQAPTMIIGATYVFSVWLKAGTRNSVSLYTTANSGIPSAACALTNTWQRFELTFIANQAGSVLIGGGGSFGSGTIIAWGADLRVTNTGVNLPPYQRVNTSTDYDTAGFPLYLKANGTNSAMQTNSIDFTGTDKMTVWAGVRKLSDAAIGSIVELSSDSGSNSGTFWIAEPNSPGSNSYFLQSRGSATRNLVATLYAAPITNVISLTAAIGGNTLSARINATSPTVADNGSLGTGNYGNYPLYLFARAGTSLFFNGQFYGAIIRGAQSTAAQISSAEQWINNKTKAYA